MESEGQHYQPFNVPDSPQSQNQGNLTGSPRIVHDLTADFYNNIQEWNGEYLKGVTLISEIHDLKLSNFNKPVSAQTTYPEGLQECCSKLEEVCNKLENIVRNLNGVRKIFEGVMKLNQMKNICSPIFTTWKIQDYVSLCKQIIDMYEKELELKLYIKENIGHSESVENVLFYQTIWVQQPYINNMDIHIEAMLKEVTLRQ